jgi:cytochrome-b5 reductase
VSGGYFYLRQGTPLPSKDGISAKAGTPAKPAFTGGEQGFLSLLLEKSETINHNTKKLTFKLPEDDMESGLPVACKPPNTRHIW